MNLNRADIGTVPIALGRSEMRLSVRGLSKSRLISAHIRYGNAGPGGGASFPRWNDAYSIGAIFQDQQSEIVVDRTTYSVFRQKHTTQLLYVSEVDHVDFSSPRHGVETLLTREFINEIADDLEVPRVTRIGTGIQSITEDAALRKLALRMYPMFDEPESLDPLHADHFMWALGVYVCANHGDLQVKRKHPGGLTTWQERLAKDLIEFSLVGGIGLAELATFCGLGTSQFARAFKRSVGEAPYQWLQRRRIARAEDLLVNTRMSLADVALQCGFADQSHLTRTFSRHTGTAPGAWRASFH